MGARLVKAAYEQFPGLPDHAMRALVYMAVTAKDTDEAPTFWEGRDALASAIGHSVVDLDDEDTQSGDAAEAAYRAVGRAVESLTVAKAISRANRPAPGRRAAYRLNLSIERETPDVPRSEPTEDAPRPASTGTRARRSMKHRTFGGSNTGRAVVRTQDAGRPPEEELGRSKEEDQKNSRPYASHGHTGSADAKDDPSSQILDETPPPTRPPLRVVAGNPSPPVVTAAATQPALWPAAVPHYRHQEDTVQAADARAMAREALKGRSSRPITRAGRERLRAAQLAAPAAQGPTPAPRTPPRERKGCGFCLPCHDEGRITLATDPENGSTCDRHAAGAMAS